MSREKRLISLASADNHKEVTRALAGVKHT